MNHEGGPLELLPSESADLHVASRLNGHLGPGAHMATFNQDARALGLNNKLQEYIRSAIIKRS